MSEPMPSDLVIQAWLSTVPAVTGVPVASRLPAPDSWGLSVLFVTALPILIQGGSHTPLETATCQVEVWGRPATAQSNRPPYGKASVLARKIKQATMTYMSPGTVTSGSFAPVRVTDVSCRSGFVRRVEDGGYLARFVGEIDITYLGE